MNRTTMSLLAALVALAAVTGFAAIRPDDTDISTLEQRLPRPVERTALTCPRPTAAESATTWYTAFTPGPAGAEEDYTSSEEPGSAALLPAAEYEPGTEGEETEESGETEESEDPAEAEPVVPLEEPGVPAAARVTDADAPALTGTAEARLAPGWTVQQTTSVTVGTGAGLLGTSCQTPDTEFWFTGASTAESRADYVHITNPDEAATVVDIGLYGPEGRLETDLGQGITVPGGATVPIRLSTLTDEPQTNLAVQVTARTGRVGALIEAVDEQLGADWLPPADAPPGPLVIPGIPADAGTVRLTVFAPGDEDVTFDVGLAGANGTIAPAGYETVSVHAGTLTAIDLENLTRGEAGSLVLTPASGSGGGAVVAAARVTLGEDGEQDMAFIPATAPVDRRATVSGNTTSGTELSLVAPSEAVEVDVTVSPGTEGGESVTETYTVDGRTTLTFAPELPESTDGTYAVTLRTNGGPLYASRALTGDEDAPGLTIQTLPDDRSTVTVPETRPELAVLMD
ncbi:DUF5719 family protein [Streptomyces litchfieldiae]|uniref:DUF5719 family protein n=1 Tax=Streptomyces litchfieldiae TaxID=3075543 RepID=A0ABU2MYT5_9ACTN|nr:DUF5719 family protein [Streptomyces sp. DSM 44938]MDT0346789.1 DUF5719 family protein [Streptomyces sp. DSM 44938]